MLRRDRNHPSVVLWSIGNEIPNQLDRDGYKMAKELIDICHAEDPTRPATSACDQSATSSRNGFMDQLDIMGYNYIDRLYNTQTYVPEHVRFPKRLMLGTETGTAIHYWLGVRNNDYVIGEFIWTGIDYLGESGTYPRRGMGRGSLISRDAEARILPAGGILARRSRVAAYRFGGAGAGGGAGARRTGAARRPRRPGLADLPGAGGRGACGPGLERGGGRLDDGAGGDQLR